MKGKKFVLVFLFLSCVLKTNTQLFSKRIQEQRQIVSIINLGFLVYVKKTQVFGLEPRLYRKMFYSILPSVRNAFVSANKLFRVF